MKATKLLSALFITSMLFTSCDFISASEEIDPDHSFHAEILDQHGNVVSTITHDSSKDDLSSKSIAVFGDDFIPDRIKESIAENSDFSPEDILQNEIYLHIASNLSEDDSYATFRFTFARGTDFKPGKFHFMNFSEDDFRKSIERIRNRLDEISGSLALSELIDTPSEFVDNSIVANVDFRQRGFIPDINFENSISDNTYFIAETGGFIEITDITEAQLSGIFETNMMAVSSEILTLEEFPEDFQIDNYTLKGTFTAKAGDLEDLASTSDHFRAF